jgi:hypothetical protein
VPDTKKNYSENFSVETEIRKIDTGLEGAVGSLDGPFSVLAASSASSDVAVETSPPLILTGASFWLGRSRFYESVSAKLNG